MKLKIGICGYGGLGRVHTRNLSQMEDVEITAVCDSRPDRLKIKKVEYNIAQQQKKKFDLSTVRTYTRIDQMLKKETLDAVVMALPTDLHAEFAIRALQAGCHVFGEKPMALTVPECDRMIAVSRRCRRQLMIGQCLRFWPEYEALKEAVKRRTYGRLLSITLERIGAYGTWSAGNWMSQAKRSGGAILDLHLHDVDWVYHVLGKPARIFAAGKKGKTGGIDDVTSVWEYRNGPLVTMRSSWLYAGFTMNFRALFEKGILEFGIPPERDLRLRLPDVKESKKIEAAPPNGYMREMKYFVDVVRGRHDNRICRPESTRESVALVYREKEAIRTGKTVIG